MVGSRPKFPADSTSCNLLVSYSSSHQLFSHQVTVGPPWPCALKKRLLAEPVWGKNQNKRLPTCLQKATTRRHTKSRGEPDWPSRSGPGSKEIFLTEVKWQLAPLATSCNTFFWCLNQEAKLLTPFLIHLPFWMVQFTLQPVSTLKVACRSSAAKL